MPLLAGGGIGVPAGGVGATGEPDCVCTLRTVDSGPAVVPLKALTRHLHVRLPVRLTARVLVVRFATVILLLLLKAVVVSASSR